ncbi:MAG: hypothetical protein FD135_2954 [Comamonadaceae bacterium]|nr:MAG: hypothetical protein FD135_2954 [Comamonadaceae bacterium]
MKAQTAKPAEAIQHEAKPKTKEVLSPVPTVQVKVSKVKAEKVAEPVVSKVTPKTVAKPAVRKDPVPVVHAKAEPVTVKKPVPKAVSAPVAAPVPPSRKKPEAVITSTPVAPKTVAKSTGPEMQMTASGVPVRTGRPSSRLAQLTVPSMAQAVASTAAKSSFTQITTPQPIVPPLASATKRDPKLANNWKSKPVTELTDAEIIAMSDDEYMNDTQMAYFRLKLVVLKDDILSNAGETTEHLREDTVVVPDPADRATIEEEHALELRTRDRERKLLKKIEQSISRIDAGDYGYCDETGEPIGVGRLLARPTATLSLEAQQRRELKQKMFGD